MEAIYSQLKQLFDYSEYVMLMQSTGLTPECELVFYQQAGIYAGIMFKATDYGQELQRLRDDYIKHHNDMTTVLNELSLIHDTSDKDIKMTLCGTCGGGQVR